MEKTREQKRQEVLKRLESTLRTKKECIAKMEKRIRELYKERTGEEPKYVGVL
jgi:flagellar motility protein MotE (MotC chaperone)